MAFVVEEAICKKCMACKYRNHQQTETAPASTVSRDKRITGLMISMGFPELIESERVLLWIQMYIGIKHQIIIAI